MRPLTCIAAAGALGVISALAFANAPVGTQIENISLPEVGGGEQMLLSDTNVSVFIFINPELEHSNHALAEISRCAAEMTNHPVRWCAIVSDRVPRPLVEDRVRELQITMPVLIDRGDTLFGKLGVIMRPSVGVTDEHRTLVAYEHFTKVNYAAVVQAQVRHALREISDAELAETLNPPAATLDKTNSVANRYFRLAGRQFAATNYDQALNNILKSLAQKPTAPAFVLQGKILLALGKTNEARTALQTALNLAPDDPAAQNALKAAH